MNTGNSTPLLRAFPAVLLFQRATSLTTKGLTQHDSETPSPALPTRGIRKTPTGIQGFDEITFGGLPTGRPTLVCGAAGAGKTLFGVEFLIRGATRYNEPGVFMSFEESAAELAENVRSLGFDLR